MAWLTSVESIVVPRYEREAILNGLSHLRTNICIMCAGCRLALAIRRLEVVTLVMIIDDVLPDGFNTLI